MLDEPFSGLDPLVRDEIIEGLLERAPETTIFLSSHDLGQIESFASHVGYLEQGRMLLEEMPALSEPLPRDNNHVEGAIACSQEHSAHVAASRGWGGGDSIRGQQFSRPSDHP